MKFGHLILRKIFKFVATRPRPLAGFKEPTFKGGERIERVEKERVREGQEREEEGIRGIGRGGDSKSWFTPQCPKS